MVAHLDSVTSLAVDQHGLYLISGSHDCSIRWLRQENNHQPQSTKKRASPVEILHQQCPRSRLFLLPVLLATLLGCGTLRARRASKRSQRTGKSLTRAFSTLLSILRDHTLPGTVECYNSPTAHFNLVFLSAGADALAKVFI